MTEFDIPVGGLLQLNSTSNMDECWCPGMWLDGPRIEHAVVT